jgi:large subunit ribosomal protein L24
MSKIKKGDTVILITGRDKGRKGAVIDVLKNDRVRVEGLNMSKKHQRPNPNANPPVQGGIIEREASVHISNVMLLNPATQKGDRVAYKLLGDGRKVRIFRSNKEQVDAK